MAAGDLIIYDKYLEAQWSATSSGLSGIPVDWESDTIKLAVLKNTFTPDTDETTTQAHWDDVSASQVATGTAYTGPITLSTVTVTVAAGTVTLDCADVTIAQDATGFTDGRYFVIYKDTGTPATSPLLYIGDLGADKSIQAGSQTFQFSGSGLVTIGATP